MFCKRCGNVNPKEAVYCNKCGYNMWEKSKQKPPMPNPSTESVSIHVSVPRHERTYKQVSAPAPAQAQQMYPPKLIAALVLIGVALLGMLLPWFSYGDDDGDYKRKREMGKVSGLQYESIFLGTIRGESNPITDKMEKYGKKDMKLKSNLELLGIASIAATIALGAGLFCGFIYRKKVWIPAGVACILFLIIFFVLDTLNENSPYQGYISLYIEADVSFVVCLLAALAGFILSLMSDSEQKKDHSA